MLKPAFNNSCIVRRIDGAGERKIGSIVVPGTVSRYKGSLPVYVVESTLNCNTVEVGDIVVVMDLRQTEFEADGNIYARVLEKHIVAKYKKE